MSEKQGRSVGPWTVTAEQTVYENPWITVIDHAVVHPDGAPGQYGVVRFKNRAIGVLAIDAQGRAALVGQHRFPLDAYSWEVPEGGGPLDEAPLEAAKRELREETGFAAKRWLQISSFDISNSVTDETAVCFLAWGLEEGEASPESSEELAFRMIPFNELRSLILAGQIRDSLTIVITLTAYALAQAGQLPDDVIKLLTNGSRK